MDEQTKDDMLRMLKKLQPEELRYMCAMSAQLVLKDEGAWSCGLGDPPNGFFMFMCSGSAAMALFNIRESFVGLSSAAYQLGYDNAKRESDGFGTSSARL